MKFTSLRASLLTYVATIGITFLFQNYHLTTEAIFHASIHGSLISFIAAYVLFFGIFLFHLMDHTGGISSIADFISDATDNRILQVLILVVGLSPLIESTSGFGVAFMMVAPIFAAIGFSKIKAVLLGLVSLIAVPWGALATGTIIGAELGGLSLKSFGFGTAILSIPVFAYFIVIAVVIAGDFKAVKRNWKQMLFIYLIFTSSILLFNYFISVELAGVLSSLIIIVIGFLMARNGGKVGEQRNSVTSMLKVFSPYIILTVLIFITRLDTPIKEFLETRVVVDLPRYSYELALLYSPGFWLLVTCIISIFIFKIKWKEIMTILRKTIKQWIPFMITTSAFVSISQIMSASGMIGVISDTAGEVFGQSFLIVAAFIGAMGGFLTGSTTSSNAMFINLQVQTAEKIGLSSELIAYTQNASSSLATMASPARVMLGSYMLGIQSKESYLLRKISLIVLGSLVLTVLMAIGIYFIM
jgi:lactate permease